MFILKKNRRKLLKNSFQENPLRFGVVSPSKKATNSPRELKESSKQSSKENKPNHQTSESNKMNEKRPNQPELVHKKLGLTTKYTKKFSAVYY